MNNNNMPNVNSFLDRLQGIVNTSMQQRELNLREQQFSESVRQGTDNMRKNTRSNYK